MDDDEKVRRNLMVTGFSVLIFFWLDLPEGALIRKILGDEGVEAVNKTKIWFLVSIVLIYQMCRFLNVLIFRKTYTAAHDDFVSLRSMMAESLARFHFKKSAGKKGVAPKYFSKPSGVEKGMPWKVVDEVLNVDYRSARIYFMDMDPEHAWAGRCSVRDVERDSDNSDIKFDFSIPVKWRGWVDLMALLRMTNSVHFVEIGVPLMCGWLALILSSYAAARSALL